MKFYLSGLGNMYSNLKHIEKAIITADEVGFDGAVMPDHYMWGAMVGHRFPNPYQTLDTWVTFTYLMGKTKNIKMGTLVTPIPFRPPSQLAKMLSTLDVLSNGRVVLGVGAGWSQDEFDGYSKWDNAKTRVDKTEEGLKLILDLWTKDEVTFKGRYYTAIKAVVDPKPVQKPYPLLLFGGVGNRMMRMAGRYGDIVYIPPWAGDYLTKKEIVCKAAEKAGRGDSVAFMAGGMSSREPYTIDTYTEKVESALKLGATYMLLDFPNDENYYDSLRKFAEDIIPQYN